MAEGRVAEVMGQRQRFGQILVEPERARERAGDLGDFQGVGQPGAVMVALMEHENLGLVREPAEGGGMDDAVAVAAEGVAGRAGRLRMEPPAAPARSRTHKARARLPPRPPCSDLPELTKAADAHLTIGQGPLAMLRMDLRMTMDNITVTERAARRIGEILSRAARHHAARQRRGRRLLRLPVQVRHRPRAGRRRSRARARRRDRADRSDLGRLLAGSEIDFVDDLIGASFRINNPQATASCGCGTSFSL